MLALTADGTVIERRSDAAEGIQRTHPITDSGTDLGRRAIWITRHIHQSGNRLRNNIIPGPLSVRSRLAIGGDGAVDGPGIDGADALVIQPQLFHHAGPETLQNHVCLCGQLLKDLHAARVLQVQDNGLFPPVIRAVVDADAVDHGWEKPVVITQDRLFNVPYLCAVIRQHGSRQRAGIVIGGIQNF